MASTDDDEAFDQIVERELRGAGRKAFHKSLVPFYLLLIIVAASIFVPFGYALYGISHWPSRYTVGLGIIVLGSTWVFAGLSLWLSYKIVAPEEDGETPSTQQTQRADHVSRISDVCTTIAIVHNGIWTGIVVGHDTRVAAGIGAGAACIGFYVLFRTWGESIWNRFTRPIRFIISIDRPDTPEI